MIVFHMDGAAVFRDDARCDGEAESRAAAFGRKLWKEEFVFVLGGNAVAGVFDANFNRLGVGVGLSRNANFAQRSVFKGLGRVIDEVHDDAAKQAAIGAHRWEIFG